ncbi:MAG TPA: class I SAM-dependent methyltransferase, partial [Vicinamibacterales bacterium]|nr:class I SAM-dependent methyltransferase [Vicinamibacterales bacterium]
GLRRAIEADWRTFNDDEESMNAGLFPAEQRFVDQHVAAGSRILLVGSGSGRELIALATGGFRVTGVEPVARTLDLCRRVLAARRIEADLRAGYIEDVAFDGDLFDVAMFSFFVYSLIPASSRRIAALKKVARAMKPHGLILVSYMIDGAPGPYLTRIARGVGAITRTDWRLEPGDAVYRTSPGALRFEHIFTRSEIDGELAAAGLGHVEASPFASYPYVLARPLELPSGGGLS